jgi:hypothetical protein
MAKVEGIFGDGFATQFDVDAGFSTVEVAARLFDLVQSNLEVAAFQMQRETPTPTSVRFILVPAPATGSIRYVITDGTEVPDPS